MHFFALYGNSKFTMTEFHAIIVRVIWGYMKNLEVKINYEIRCT